MKGQTITETIDGKDYDITVMGAEEAIEAQSIFMSMIIKSGMDLDADLSPEQLGSYMMCALDRPTVSRVKELFKNCVKAPIIDDVSFSNMEPETVTSLFLKVHHHQTAKASKKKDKQKKHLK